MRRLILLRHAKSSWPEGVEDHSRPLAERGLAQAPIMGRYLATELITPDFAIVSTARRAQETWALAAAAFPEPIPQRDEPLLFAATSDRIIAVAQSSPAAARVVALVGHNPGFHETAIALTGHGDRYAFARLRQKYPTCALAILDFDVESWREIAPRAGRLDRFVTPKALGGEDAD